jgi:uncharacterized protein (TIGR02147 family)
MDTRSLDFTTYLQEELVLRCKNNPAYSLRSFANNLDISPSFLSKILNRKRRVTDKVFKKLTTHLKLDSYTLKSFNQRMYGNEDLDYSLYDINLEYFKVISDWYHFALLELLKVDGFNDSYDWMATRLGINANHVQSAVERLLKLGLLEKVNGKLIPSSSGNTTLNNNFTDMAFKKMQNDLLKKAISSLWDVDIEKRDQTSICMAIDPSDIKEVKKRLTKVRREMCEFLERPKENKPTQVYNLSLSFFPLSKELP